MAKKKKNNNRAVGILLFVLMLLMVLVWGLVACQDLLPNGFGQKESASSGKDKNDDLEEVVDSTTQEVAEADPEEVITTEEVKEQTTQIEEVTTEVVVTTSDEVGQGDVGGGIFDDTLDPSTLSNESYSWSWKRNSEHLPPIAYNQGIDLEQYGAYYKVDTQEKVIYLTFDEGYENGYTSQILDILKANDVQVTFFVTKPYINSNVDLCNRMKAEGHLVGNHSVTHSSFPTLSDEEIGQELYETAGAFLEATGYEIDTFFRPPSGTFSERVLFDVRKSGYRTIFWSLGYGDWDAKNQPGKEFAYSHIMENFHPGGIFLLHGVSQSTTEALDDVIKALKTEGYRFGNLYEIE